MSFDVPRNGQLVLQLSGVGERNEERASRRIEKCAEGWAGGLELLLFSVLLQLIPGYKIPR
jgi:hypothetical protein